MENLDKSLPKFGRIQPMRQVKSFTRMKTKSLPDLGGKNKNGRACKTAEVAVKPPSICNICLSSDNPCVAVQGDYRRVLTVTDITRLPSWNIRQLLTSVCSRCLLLINSLTDTSHLLRVNCRKSIETQHLIPPELQTPDNSDSNAEMTENEAPSQNVVHSAIKIMTQNKTSPNVAVAPTTIQMTTKDPKNKFLKPTPKEVIDKKQESVNVLPSALPISGKIEQSNISLVCPYCNRSYRRNKSAFQKHYRACVIKTNTLKRKCFKSVATQGTASVASLEKQPTTFQHQCVQCSAIFETGRKLKEHQRSHYKIYCCDICSLEFTTEYMYDFHRVQCKSELEVRLYRTAKHDDMIARRITRGYSRAPAEDEMQCSAKKISRLELRKTSKSRERLKAKEKSIPSLALNANVGYPADSQQSKLTREAHNELNISQLATESGGAQYLLSYKYSHRLQYEKICYRCNRSFKRKDYYLKHIRSCAAKRSYAKSLQEAARKCRLTMDSNELAELVHQLKPPRIFYCPQCSVTAESIGKLYEHKRTHYPRYRCDICNCECTTKYHYDFHRAECTAKLEGQKENELDANSGRIQGRRRTRAYSQAFSVAPTECSGKRKLWSSTIDLRDKHSKSAISLNTGYNKFEGDAQAIVESVKQNPPIKSCLRQHSKSSAISLNASCNNSEDYHNKGESEDEDDDELYILEDDVSETDSIFSCRLSFTKHWIQIHSKENPVPSHNNYRREHSSDDGDMSFLGKDLCALERLKYQVDTNEITCTEPNCCYTCNNLNLMMVHDYIDHLNVPRYYCRKCGDCFTKKLFLDYHMDIQDTGHNYVCCKCGLYFPQLSLLQRHLILHNKQSREEEHNMCHYCYLQFVDRQSLHEHCLTEGHSSDSRKPTIAIDHSMSISNDMPLVKQIKQNRDSSIYRSQVILIPTPKNNNEKKNLYTKNLRIGRVQFEPLRRANCVGTNLRISY